MAAFEAVSSVNIRPFNRVSLIDFRFTYLPHDIPPIDEYDPAKHRKPARPIKVSMAYFNIVRSLFGAGVLGLPLGVGQVGIIMGPLVIMLLGFLLIHMHITLLWCLNEISRQLKIPYISYRYGFRIALLHGPLICRRIGHYGPTIIAVLMVLSQLGICTVFVVFTTDSLRDIMDWPNSNPAIAFLLLPYILLLYFMKTLKIVSYISLIGNFLNFVALAITIYHIFLDPHGELVYYNFNALEFFIVIGIGLFNLSAVGVILSLDKALQDPTLLTKCNGIIDTPMFVTCLMSTVFGALGYWSFGKMEENVLRYLPYDDMSAMAAIGLYLISVAFAFPIQCFPATQIIVEVIKNWNPYSSPSQATLDLIESIARPLFVITAFFMCYLVPIQGALVAFVGNMCTTLLALVFPAMMELCILYPNHFGRYNVYLVKDLAIVAFGLCSWILGVLLCGYLIYVRILSLKSPNNPYYF